MKINILIIMLYIPFFIHANTIKTRDGKVYKNAHFALSKQPDKLKIICKEKSKIVSFEFVLPFSITTQKNKKYKDVIITKITKKDVRFYHTYGAKKCKFSELSKKSQKLFGYDEERIKRIRLKREAFLIKKLRLEQEKYLNSLKSGNEFLAKLKNSVKKSTHSKVYKKINISQSILFIEGSQGAGSGFFANLKGNRVVMTNAHVYVLNENIKIFNHKGEYYKVKDVLVSKNKDIVILNVIHPKAAIPLEIASSIDKLSLNTAIAAYGNSLGEKIITIASGKMIGIGKSRIEINADIVPGNSGGPVLNTKDKSVIGISTYLKYITPMKATQGTRFGSNFLKTAIRRFALRIDNLNINDFEVSLEKNRLKDLKTLNKMSRINTSIFSGKSSTLIKETCIDNFMEVRRLENYSWSLKYLAKEFNQKKVFFYKIADILGVDASLVLAKKIRSLKSRYMKQVHISAKYSYIPCSYCNGKGFEWVTGGNKKKLGGGFRRKDCPYCKAGRIKKMTSPPSSQVIIPKRVTHRIAKLISPININLFGFYLGESKINAMKKLRYANPTYKNNGIIEEYIYSGNNIFKSAIKTKLTFLFTRLKSIKVFLKYSPRSFNELKYKIKKLNNKKIETSIEINGSEIHITYSHKLLSQI